MGCSTSIIEDMTALSKAVQVQKFRPFN
jgi:hypothetical protein